MNHFTQTGVRSKIQINIFEHLIGDTLLDRTLPSPLLRNIDEMVSC